MVMRVGVGVDGGEGTCLRSVAGKWGRKEAEGVPSLPLPFGHRKACERDENMVD